jgi:NitT/TauT family transport system permease protein
MSLISEASNEKSQLKPETAALRPDIDLQNLWRPLLGSATVLAVLLFWEVAVRLLHVPAYVVPSPSAAFIELIEKRQILFSYALVTALEILAGFVAGALGGGFLGIVLFRSPMLAAALNPLVIFFQIIPKIALAPIFLLWFGFGYGPKILLVAIIAFFPVTLNMISGLAATNPDLGFLVKSAGGTTGQYLWRVQLPSALPQIFAGLKIAMTFSVIGAVVGEFTGGSEGLGYMILFSSSRVETPLLFASLFAISILGLVLYYSIVLLEYLLVPWQRN